MEQLRWQAAHTSQTQQQIRPGRWSLQAGETLAVHCHDFWEVFWVESGAGVHLLNGDELTIEPGDCFFIRAQDAHGFHCRTSSVAWSNVSIPDSTHTHLRERFAQELGWWPWPSSGPPHRCHLTPTQMTQLGEAMQSLPMDQQRALDAEWFMMGVLRAVSHRYHSGAEQLPEWLEQAIERFASDPLQLQQGLSALIFNCARCTEHVNRTVRHHLDMTSTDLINQLRLDYAAQQLRLTRKDILNVALEAGFENLSYFYRRFKSRFGTSPHKFRKGPAT